MFGRGLGFGLNATRAPLSLNSRNLAARAWSAGMEQPMFRYLGEIKGFVDELRFQAMRLHAKEQADERVAKRGPSVEVYLKFLVDSKKVYETMEAIIMNSSHPSCESSSIVSRLGCHSAKSGFRIERDALALSSLNSTTHIWRFL